MEKEITRNILVVDDDPGWLDKIKKGLSSRGFTIQTTLWGTEGLEIIKNDKSCEIKAAVLDWYLYIPGKKPEEEQELQGPALCDEIIKLRPELPVFALTIVEDPKEVASTSLRHRFTDFFPKKSLSPDHPDRTQNYDMMTSRIKDAIHGMEELISAMPTGKRWETNRTQYLNLRRSYEWSNIEAQISNKAERLFERYFENQQLPERSLRDNLGVTSDREPDIVNILIGRRVVFAAILQESGAMHRVEEGLGYKLPEDETVEDDMKMYSGAFKVYLAEGLAISYKDFLNEKGILPEERQWLEKFCEKNDIEISFPVIR